MIAALLLASLLGQVDDAKVAADDARAKAAFAASSVGVAEAQVALKAVLTGAVADAPLRPPELVDEHGGITPMEDLAPPSVGCGGIECEIAAACASADPGPAAEMCAKTVLQSFAIRVAKKAGLRVFDLGAVTLTHLKAASVRDDLASKNARIAVLEAGSGIDWPLVLIVAGGASAVVGAVVGAIAYGVGHAAGAAQKK